MSGPNFCLIWVKNEKKLIIFENFTLVSLKVTKLIIKFLPFVTKMLFKEFVIWAFWGQNVGAGWFNNGIRLFSYQPPYYQHSFS